MICPPSMLSPPLLLAQSLSNYGIPVIATSNPWRECFMSWRRWSEYLEMGMASIAAHAIALPATTFFFNQNGSDAAPGQYQNITRLLMLITRLANDMQSYQKEVADGKMNLVVLRWRREGKGETDSGREKERIPAACIPNGGRRRRNARIVQANPFVLHEGV